MTEQTQTVEAPAELITPIVIDLGKKKRKQIKRLKKGRGRLVGAVEDVLNEVRASLGEQGLDKQLVPVVLIYRRRRKKRKARASLFYPFLR